MVTIVTSFGPPTEYPDQDMMKKTLLGFLNSILRQTDPEWRLFISCHTPADFAPPDKRIFWLPMEHKVGSYDTVILRGYPEAPSSKFNKIVAPWDGKITDMGRKTINSIAEAARWAWFSGIKKFWMLRMDSDDLLNHEMVKNLHKTTWPQAVFNRRCYLFDPRLKELGIQRNRFSTTCNCVFYEFEGAKLPNWFLHANDHTMFSGMVKKLRLRAVEWNYTLCIITNSCNSISGRGGIRKEAHSAMIPMDAAVSEMFGLDYFGEGNGGSVQQGII